MNFVQDKFALTTIHRQESTRDNKIFLDLMEYVEQFAQERNLKVVFPVHPRVQNIIQPYKDNTRFFFLEPVTYFEMQYLLGRADVVLTDSGGLRKEAYFHRVPCVTLRSETEWVETIEAGWNKLWTESYYQSQKSISDYGHGKTAQSIMEILAC